MASVDTLSVGEVFANPTRYTSLLNRCGIGLPGPGQNLTLPTTGNFDFICLNLLNITTGEQCKVFAGASYKLYSGIDVLTRILS
jgi:hypothetical protein